MSARRIVLLGPPGAGKGTQAVRISKHLAIPAISTGAIFRAQKAAGTALGAKAAAYMDRGEYVPDDLTDAMVEERLSEADAREGFLLDGYPRTDTQVTALDDMMGRAERTLDLVLLIEASAEDVVQRLLGRAQKEGRADDTEEVIRHRLDVYDAETAPLVEIYRRRGVLVSVDGRGDIDEVAERIRIVLDKN